MPYPVACARQAWSAASVLLLFQACLGLSIDGVKGEICFARPELPAGLDELRIRNLRVAGATGDLFLVRHARDVGVNVLALDGDVRIIVESDGTLQRRRRVCTVLDGSEAQRCYGSP